MHDSPPSDFIERFALDPAATELISQSQNRVYAVRHREQPAILRISRERHRTLAEIEAELGWVRELAAAGLPVGVPRQSTRGRWCEPLIADGVESLAVLFDRVPGRRIERADLTSALYRQLGQLTARLHQAAFTPHDAPHTRLPRAPWYESRLLTHDLERFSDADDHVFRESLRALISELLALPNLETGLIHADISFSNTFLSDAGLWLFDFDNCETGSPLQDLATVLYDSIYCRWVNRVPVTELAAKIQDCWQEFLSGYREIRPLAPLELETLRQFCVLREGVIYIHYRRTLPRDAISPSFREGMHEMRRNVEACVTPFPWRAIETVDQPLPECGD